MTIPKAKHPIVIGKNNHMVHIYLIIEYVVSNDAKGFFGSLSITINKAKNKVEQDKTISSILNVLKSALFFISLTF